MASDAEESIFKAAASGLKTWLGRAKERVLAPFRSFRAPPDPSAIAATKPLWQDQLDRIVAALTPAQREGWVAANLPGEFDPNDPYIQANVALTRNLLVRIPDEVHALVVAQILRGAQEGLTTEQIAANVDDVLTYTGSENWPNRGRLIAQTELTRHRASSMLAHAFLLQRDGARELMKKWVTTMDNKERLEHRLTNEQIRPLDQPFQVGEVNGMGGVPMMHPGDPTAPPELVCNCRCDLRILRGREG